MEIISQKLARLLIDKRVVAETEYDVYQYGLLIGLEVFLNTMISIFIAVSCDMVLECILFFVTFIPLRAFAGGIHLNKYITCMICSCLSLLGILLLVKHINIDIIYLITITFISSIAIKILSPVKDVNRPVDDIEVDLFVKRLNYTLIIINSISIIFYVFHLNKLLFTICITQIFMIIILILGKMKYKNDIKTTLN